MFSLFWISIKIEISESFMCVLYKIIRYFYINNEERMLIILTESQSVDKHFSINAVISIALAFCFIFFSHFSALGYYTVALSLTVLKSL